MQKLWYGLLAIVWIYAPQQGNGQPLRKGDVVPDKLYSGVLNYRTDTLRLSHFRGKKILLDFWNHKCGACISAFPKMDSLQKALGDRLQIVLVNRESREATMAFFEKRKKIKMPALPMITGAEALVDLFSPESMPYHAWLHEDLRIAYITEGHNTTFAHLRAFVNEDSLRMLDPTRPVKKYGSLTAMLEGERMTPLFASTLAKYNERTQLTAEKSSIVNDGKSMRMVYHQASVLQLYLHAFRAGGKFNFPSRYAIRLQVKDSFPYIIPGNDNLVDAWFREHAYNYELIIPIDKAGERFSIMQADLNRYFNVQGAVVMESLPSYVLVKRKGARLQTRKEPPKNDLAGMHDETDPKEHYAFTNQPVDLLLRHLRLLLGDKPFYSDLAYKGHVDIVFDRAALRPVSLEALRKNLKAAGLDIIIVKRPTPVLTITEKPK